MGFRRNPASKDELRALASQRVAGRVAKAATALTLPEAQQLLEELDIHQIELELQNEHLNASRVQLEAALNESTALYDFSPVGSLLLDQQGAITKLNLASAGLLGSERARLIGIPFASLVGEKDRSMLPVLLEQAARSGEVEVSEITLTARDEAPPSTVEVRVALLPDTLGWQVNMTDITDRKQFEEKLRASEVRWKLALDAAGDGVWAWNVQSGEVVFSARCAQLLGYEKSELGRRIDDWNARIHPDDRTQVMGAYQAHLAGQAPSFFSEHRCLCKDGSWKWVLSRGAIVHRAEDGRALRMIGTYVDISKRKRIEEALLTSLQIQQAVFDALSAQLAVLDSDGVVVQTNTAWRACAADHGLAGAPDFIGGTYQDFVAAMTANHSATLEATAAGLAAVIGGTLPHFQLPQPFFVANGQRWFSMKVTPVLDARHRVVVSHEDVTLLKAAELASLTLANIDALTGAISRRHFMALAEQELVRATRYQLPLMVLMMDLDHFKVVNDQHGHAVGDLVLQSFVKTVSSVLRETDLLGRVGGEEFVVLLPNTNALGGAVLGQRIVECVRNNPTQVNGQRIAYTVSIGGCSLSTETSLAPLLQLADNAMYQAKHKGRDRLELATWSEHAHTGNSAPTPLQAASKPH